MPATTRSRNLTTLEHKGVSSSKPAPQKSQGQKRKAATSAKAPSKKQKAATGSKETNSSDDNTILINRAPVLELWASCVSHALYPKIPWSTCLSIGGAISTITAISKGRSIGTMDKPHPGEAQAKRERRREEQAELDEVEVMGFHLKLKDGLAMVGDKPKKGNEELLRKKYGDEQYEKVKSTLKQALSGWKGKEEELNSRAFGMYEDFRPNILPGQKGWGRKGQLNIETIKSAVECA